MEKDNARIELEDRCLAAFRTGGVAAYARVRLRAMRDRHWEPATDFFLPEWYLDAGGTKKSLENLETMVSEHDPEAVTSAVSPAFRSLHQDARFQALIAHMGLSLPRTYPTPFGHDNAK